MRSLSAAGILALACALVAPSCGKAPPAEPTAAPAPRFPVLDGADADSPVRLAAIEKLIERVEGGVPSLTAMAYQGQRLRWKMTVDTAQGPRIIAGAGSVRVSLVNTSRDIDGELLTFEPGDEIQVVGAISFFDPKAHLLMLASEATAAPLQ
jgi:hypothetical protein